MFKLLLRSLVAVLVAVVVLVLDRRCVHEESELNNNNENKTNRNKTKTKTKNEKKLLLTSAEWVELVHWYSVLNKV